MTDSWEIGHDLADDAIRPLGATLERTLTVGSNLRGRAGGGTLAFGLPSLAPRRIVCLGRPFALVEETLRRLSPDGSVTVIQSAGSAVDIEEVDVLWVSGPPGIGLLRDDQPAIDGLIERASSVIVERVPDAAVATLVARLTTATRTVVRLGTITADGIVKAATLGSEDQTPAVAAGEAEPWLRRVVDRTHRMVRRKHVPTLATGVALLGLPGDPRRPPAWVSALLMDGGVDPELFTWRLASPGIYDSQKLLVHLEPLDVTTTALIVKVTRDGRHNERLATEAAALPAVAALGPLGGLVIPRLVAAGPVGRLWAAVETREAGAHLPGVIRARIGPQLVERAVEGLTALSVASARDVAGRALAEPFADLRDRYLAIHRPGARTRTVLDRLLAQVEDAERVPIVAQHGDPGSWNMLATAEGRIVMLDWESFERDGPPLWDLWHFLRSITIDLDRAVIPRRTSALVTRAFLGTGPANDHIAWATARYRRSVPIADELVLPLFVFGWLHRALKEATRRQPERVADGPYARFLRAVLDDLDAPGLRRIAEAGRSG